MSAPRASHAAWGPNPIAVHNTLANIPSISACTDGAYGAFVAWQDDSLGLCAHHVLANGDLDPAWPAAGRRLWPGGNPIRCVSDGAGGVFVVWNWGGIDVVRLTAGGVFAPGWSTGPRFVCVYQDADLSAVSDAAHGLWITAGSHVVHLGPDGNGAEGSPSYGVLLPEPPATFNEWTRVVRGDAGDAYVLWASMSWDSLQTKGSWRLLRLLGSGALAPGWPAAGLSLGRQDIGERESDPNNVDFYPSNRMLDVAMDGRGGVFAMTGLPLRTGEFRLRVFRIAPDGSVASGWPSPALSFPDNHTYYDGHPISTDPAVLVLPDGADGAFLGMPDNAVHEDTAHLRIDRYDMAASPVGDVATPVWRGIEFVSAPGRAYVGSMLPQTLAFPFGGAPAMISLRATDAGGWYEQNYAVGQAVYGDIAIAPLEDGAAMLFWSQYVDRRGLYASRIGAAGAIVGVAPVAAAPSLRDARFVRGSGVRARLDVPAGADARLALYDVAGRRLAVAQAGAGGAQDVAFNDTAALAAGVYFVRAEVAGTRFAGKVVVLP